MQSLLGKGLIEEAGRRDTLGHPMQFRTTDAFLRHFGISSLDELPQIQFDAQSASPEAVAEAEQMALELPEAEEERDGEE